MNNSDPVKGGSSPQYLSISKEKPPLNTEQTKTKTVFQSHPHYEGVTSDSPHELPNDFSMLFADNGHNLDAVTVKTESSQTVKTESSQKVKESRFRPENMHDMAVVIFEEGGKANVFGLVQDRNPQNESVFRKAFKEGNVRYYDVKTKVFHLKKGEQVNVNQLVFSSSASPGFKANFMGKVTVQHHDQEEFDEMHTAFMTYMNDHPVGSEEVKHKEVQEEKAVRNQHKVGSGEVENSSERKKSHISPQNLQIVQDIVFNMIHMSERKFQKKMEKIEEEKQKENIRVVHEEIKEKELEKQNNKPRL